MCAKIRQGILGGFSGKIAGVVGTSWKGIAVIKALPLSVANPKTAGQVAQRSKFSNASKYGSSILSEIIKPLWDRFAQQASGYNDWVRTNISLFSLASPSPAASLVISSGKMSSTAVLSAEGGIASTDIDVSWTNDSGSGLKLSSDTVYILIYNETQETFGFEEGTVTRDEEVATVSLTAVIEAGDVAHCYLAFRREDGTIVSNTGYLIVSLS